MTAMDDRVDLSEADVSPREAEVLDLLGQHLTHTEIGERLFISVRTVESHAASLRRKLGLADRQELMRFAAVHREDSSTSVSLGPPPNLPTPLTSFVGRDVERKELANALTEARLVTAVGPGGVGKTRLAIAVAEDMADGLDREVFYVDLVPVTDPAMVVPAVLTALGLSENSARFLESALRALVADREALLVVDNAEHVINEVATLVERMLNSSPRLTALITSRIRLTVPFERVYEVPGLSLSQAERSDQGDAVRLFVERATATGHPQVTGSELLRIGSICAALGGSALAIELAAARLPSLGLDGLESGLEDQMGVLIGGSRADMRHRSLRNTLDWSYRLLDPVDQSVLRRVSTFASEFSVPAAREVAGFGDVDAGDVADSLARLVDSSLLTTVGSSVEHGTHYRALETIRQYGRVQIDAADDQETLEHHLQWCLTVATQLNESEPEDTNTRDARFDANADDLRLALEWAASQPGQRAAAHHLAATLGRLLFHRGRIEESQRRYEQAAELSEDAMTASISYRRAAAVATCRLEGEQALRLLRAAAEAAERAGDPVASGALWARAAEQVNRWPGMFVEPPSEATAEALLSRARARTQDDRLVEATVLVATAHAASMPPNRINPELVERAIDLARMLGDPLLENSALDALSLVKILRFDITAAAATYRQQVERLTSLALEPETAVEIRDAIHGAVYTNIAAGRINDARHAAEHQATLPFLRQDPHLAKEELMAVDALAGRWDRVLSTSKQVRTSWERAGRPGTPGAGIGPAAVAMVHGLRGDEKERNQWLEVLAAYRGVDPEQTTLGPGYGEVFDAIVLLHHGHNQRAHALLATEPSAPNHWHVLLFSQWRIALQCEAAVLADATDIDELITSAETSTAGNPIASAIVARARALFTGDHSTLSVTATAFDDAGCGYQMARSLILAGGEDRQRGMTILADMGAVPMAEAFP